MSLSRWVNIKDELPTNPLEYYIVNFNEKSNWHEDRIDVLLGKDICNSWKDVIKCWLKEIE